MNPIDPVNYLSCTILGLKTALFEAEKENRCLQRLLLSFYVKDAAKETDLYKMNRTGVKMNVLFQKEKQDLNLKIQELEARLVDSESENVNLNFQVRELKAFLEEKTNLLELYNSKDAKSEKLLLNNLKERDLIQIIRNVLVCMKKGRVSRALQKSLKRLEQRKNKNLKKIKSEESDAEISDDEIDLMSTMIENRLEEDNFSYKCERNESSGLQDDNFLYKCERNESSGLQSIDESSETPTIDLNKSDITGAETNSSHGNAMDCISMDHSIFSPLSIADSDYSSNGIKSVESLNSEKVQSADSICETNISPVEVDIKPSSETNTVLAEADAKPSCETDILGSELNAELKCETNVLPLENDLKPSCEIDVLPAEEDPKPSCEADFPPLEFDAEPRFKIHILLTENDVKSSCETSVSPEEDAKPSFETNIIMPEMYAKSSCETNILPTESHGKPNCETNILPTESHGKPNCETNVLPTESHGKPNCETNILPTESHGKPKCETNLSVALDAEPNCENNILPAERDTSDSRQETVSNCVEASVDDIQSDDLVTDPVEILECDPFIDPEIVNSAVDLILTEMINISHSNAIVESFRKFCKNDIHLDADQKTSVLVQNTDESLTSESTSSNLATQLISHDVGHESIPVKRKIDISSQNSLKKVRLDEDVSNSSVENTALAFVRNENTNADKIHPLEDETNQNSSKVEDDNTENIFRASILENNIIKIDPKLEHQKISIPNNAINQDTCESSDVLLPHPETQSDIVTLRNNELALDSEPCLETSEMGTLESHLDKSVISRSDFRVSERPPVGSSFDVETGSIDCSRPFVLNEDTSASNDQDDSSVPIEKKSDLDAVQVEVTENTNQVEDHKNTNQVENPENTNHIEDTEFINEEDTIIDEVTSIREAGKDLSYILKEFAALEEEMRRRMTVFKEFMLQEDNCGEIETLDEMEYIVVAEILEDCDFEISRREAFIDNSSLPDDVLNSLHETSLKTVELQASKENLSIHCESRLPEEKFFMPAFDSMIEVTDTSDDEKDELVIVEDDHVDDNSVTDTALNRSGVFRNEENNHELVSANAPEKLVSNSHDAHSVLKENQPIKEITNIPRYNFRRSAAFSDSASETSPSLYLLPVENSAHSTECSRESVTSTAQEPSKTVQMQFYVENQSSTLDPLSYTSVFDEVWSKIKLDWCEDLSHVTSDTPELMPCKSSIMKLVFVHKDPQKDSKLRKEEVPDLTFAKNSLEVFLKEKIRNHALAFNAFSSTVCHLDKTTLCCAVIEILLDSVTFNNARRHEIIFRDFLYVCTKLNSTIFQGFVDELKKHLKTRMWVKDWEVKQNGHLVNDLRLLSKFFTRLSKLDDDSHSVISLLRESLLSFKFRGHPIAFSVLKEWPEIFPRDAEERNLIARIILFTLVNHKMDYNQILYNIEEVQKLIHDLFNVKLGMKTAVEYAKELMLQFSDTTWEDAIVLLCKRQMFHWTYSNVIMKYLLPILKKWKTEYFPEEILNKVLRALKMLLGACPFNIAENEMFNLDVIVNVLEEILSSQKGSCELKETVILVLCDLSIYRFSLCVGILENWKPPGGVIRRSTFQLLRDQLKKYRYNWQDFLFPKKNSCRTRENKLKEKAGFNGLCNTDSSCPKNTHAVISVGVTKKMNKNRPLPNRLMKDNPIPNNRKKKKNSKKKRKGK